MDEEIEFMAPNGVTIAGAVQDAGEGHWAILWEEGRNGEAMIRDYVEHGGPDGADWDNVEIDGVFGDVVFVDDNEERWLMRHLIREGAEPLSEAAIALARRDYFASLGADLAEKARAALYDSGKPFLHAGGPVADLINAAGHVAILAADQAEQLKRAWAITLRDERAAGRGVAPVEEDEDA